VTDLVEYLILGALVVETCVWLFVLHRTGQIQRALQPIVDRVLPFLSRLPQQQPSSTTPPIPTEVRMTKKGQPYYIDPVTGLARFLPKGTSVVPGVPAAGANPESSAPGTGEVDLSNIDLNSPIAQQFMGRIANSLGVDTATVRQYAEGIVGPGSTPAVGVPGVPPAGAQGQDALIENLLTGLVKGEVKLEDALVAGLPLFLNGLRQRQGTLDAGREASVGYW
jgi:hypothetical protein